MVCDTRFAAVTLHSKKLSAVATDAAPRLGAAWLLEKWNVDLWLVKNSET